MKLLKRAILIALIALPLLAAGWTATVSAASFRTGQSATVAKDETLDESVYLQGNRVAVSGTVNGDVYCAGQSVTISGTVNGDVICGAQNIRIGGTVNGDIRLASQFIEVSGKVESNASIAAQTFTLQEGGSITGDVTLAASEAEIAGTVDRDLVGGLAELVITGHVGRDVALEVERLTVADTARVGGAIQYASDMEAKVQDGATVQGGITREEPADTRGEGAGWAAVGFGAVSLFVIAMILVLVAPRIFQGTSEEGRIHTVRSLVAGLLTAFVVPVLILLLLLTVVGIPLAILLGLVWVVILFLAGPAAAYYIGRMVMRQSNNALIYMAVGTLLLLVLYALPFIGVLFVMAALIFGSGMIISWLTRRIGKPVYAFAEPKAQKKK